MAIDIMIGNRVGCSKSSGGMVLKDGVFLYPTVITGDERRYKVEVWKDGKMLFPEYDNSVPGRNLWAIKYKDFINFTSTTYYAQFNIATSDLKYGEENFYTFSAKVKRNIEIAAVVYGNVGYVRNDGVTNNDYYRINPTNTGGNTWDYVGQFYFPELQAGLLIDRINIRLERTSVSMEKNFDFGKFKLEEGNNPNPVWTPAPEELLELAKITATNCSYKIDGDELVLYGFTDNNGTVNIEVSYGDDWVRSKSTTWTANFSSRSLEIFKYASSNGYILPTKQVAYDEYIRGLINSGLFDKLDLHYIFSGDGDTNFKLINVVSPGVYNGTAFGGLEWSAEGVKGNGVNGYVDTNFNPSLLVEGQKFQLNNAIHGVVAYYAPAFISHAQASMIYLNGGRNRLTGAGLSGYNINSNQTFSTGFSSQGFKAMVRYTSVNIASLNKNVYVENEQQSTNILPNTYQFLRYVDAFSEYGLSNALIGASLTYEETQIFRELFNKYLKSNNLQEIA